jgi:chaperone required for assembly of F1-ATPase
MSWAAKRFWTKAEPLAQAGGFGIVLDDRPVKTPSKAALVVPTLPMAEAIAAEWEAQTGKINPETMPFTRSANSAIDKVAPQFAEVATMIASYGGSDLLCYRATFPTELIERQAAVWDPVLDWAAVTYGARLVTTRGVMPVPQSAPALTALSSRVHGLTPFELAAVHDLVAISGSLVLGLAVAEGFMTAEAAFSLSRIDEGWQVEHWGADDDAAESDALKQAAMTHAGRFFALCG